MRNWTSFIAVIALIAYLAVVFVDCEPDAPFQQGIAIALADFDIAQDSHGQSSGSHDHSAGPGEATGQTAHSHVRHGHDTAPGRAGSRADGNGSAVATPIAPATRDAEAFESRPRRGAWRTPTRLVWDATCLCGCEASRGAVGGALSRLGPVVPGIYLASRFPFEEPNALPWIAPKPSAISFQIDPIPI